MILALAAVNPHRLTGSAWPRCPHEPQTRLHARRPARAPLRWARQESGVLIGTCASGHWPREKNKIAGEPPPGRELRLAARPGSFYLAADITRIDEEFGAPPHWHVRKKLESRPLARDSRLHIEWIARGLTAVCFWTAPWRWITRAGRRGWFGVATPDCARPD